MIKGQDSFQIKQQQDLRTSACLRFPVAALHAGGDRCYIQTGTMIFLLGAGKFTDLFAFVFPTGNRRIHYSVGSTRPGACLLAPMEVKRCHFYQNFISFDRQAQAASVVIMFRIGVTASQISAAAPARHFQLFTTRRLGRRAKSLTSWRA